MMDDENGFSTEYVSEDARYTEVSTHSHANHQNKMEEKRRYDLIQRLVALFLLFALLGLVWLGWLWSRPIAPPIFIYPQPGTIHADKRLTIQGVGTRGSIIRAIINGQTIGEAAVKTNGIWSLTTYVEQVGEHWVLGHALNRTGDVVAASDPFSFILKDSGVEEVIPCPQLPYTTTREMTSTIESISASNIIISNAVASLITVQVGAENYVNTPSATDGCTEGKCPQKPQVCECESKDRDCLPTNAVQSCKTKPHHYTVVVGDTLSSISRRFGIDYRRLLTANPQLKDPNRIFVGQVINLPVR